MRYASRFGASHQEYRRDEHRVYSDRHQPTEYHGQVQPPHARSGREIIAPGRENHAPSGDSKDKRKKHHDDDRH